MARPLRIEFHGAVHHVTSRGNAKQSIFLDDQDREDFLRILEKTVSRFRWICHAYCLMGNHYHLLIETPIANLSKGMRHLNGVYTQSFNRRHERVGHLFQGRFKSVVVEKDSHLKELCRYVVLNPVRAKMEKHPAQWKWSSYRATIGVAEKPGWLHTNWVLSQFGAQRKRAVKSYAEFVRDGAKTPVMPWERMRHQIVLGTEGFIQRVLGKVPMDIDLSEIPKAQRVAPPKPLADILLETGDKKKAIIAAYGTGFYSQKEIADFLGYHYCTINREIGKSELLKPKMLQSKT